MNQKTGFCNNLKTLLLQDLVTQINKALKIDDEVTLAFDVFNTNTKFTEEESWQKIEVMKSFYGSPQYSVYENGRAEADPVVNIDASTVQKSVHYVYKDFKQTIK